MNTVPLDIKVRLSKDELIQFHGVCLARVIALNHDNTIRRQFSVYSRGDSFVAERIDSPDTIDVRFWGATCHDSEQIYDFFGNEPLANYLYGVMNISVPGLQIVQPV